MKPLFIKKNGTVSKVSGIIMNLIPSYTMAEYNALTHKPLLWVRTDEDYAQIPATDVSYGSGSVKDALDYIATQLASKANIKKGVNWNTAETIPLSTNPGFYSLKCGHTSVYADLFIVYDGGWKLLGTNDVGVTISGNNLIIPRYARYLLIW